MVADVVPGVETTVSTGEGEVQIEVPAGALPTSTVMKVQRLTSASILPPTGRGRRAVGKTLAVKVEVAGEEQPELVFEEPIEIRLQVTDELRDAAAGDERNLILQQKDTATGKWMSLSTSVDDTTGELVAETTRSGPVVATVPGPPPRAGEVLAILNPSTESVLAPPPSPGAPPPPVVVARAGTTQEIVTLVYSPRQIPQLPAAAPGDALVGQPFELEAYRLDKALPGIEFATPLDLYVPFSQGLLDVVEGDARKLELAFYDREASPPGWVVLPTEVLANGIYAPVAHLTLFSLTAPADLVSKHAPVETPAVPLTASLYLSSFYHRSITLGLGEVAFVEAMLDSGGTPVRQIEATIAYPEQNIRVLHVDTEESVCDQWPSGPTQEPGRILIRCSISGDGDTGRSGRVAGLVLWAQVGGLTEVAFTPESRVLAVKDNVDVLGFTPAMVLAIATDVPPVVYPEPVVAEPPDEGISLRTIVVLVLFVVGVPALGLGLALIVLSALGRETFLQRWWRTRKAARAARAIAEAARPEPPQD